MAYPAKYRQIYSDLKIEIENGKYPVGTFLPPERVLCEKYDVQRMTLRKSLDLLVDDHYISKAKGAGSKVTYEPAPVKNNSSFYFVIPEYEFSQQFLPYHWDLCIGIEDLCKENNQEMSFKIIKDNEDISSWLLNSDDIGGIIWDTPIDHSLLDIARNRGIPCISLCGNYPGFTRVNFDDVGGSYMSTQHLIDMGCRRIVMLKGLDSYVNTPLRVRGYRLALLENNIPIDEDLILEGGWTHDGGFEIVNQLLDSGTKFDGIMASNDMMALGAIKSLYQHGLSIPHDIKVTGIDNIQYSSISTPSLSTVSFDKNSVASICYLLLNEVIQGHSVPEEVIIPGSLIVRESTGLS